MNLIALVLSLLLLVAGSKASIDCLDTLTSTSLFVGQCSITWSQLKPLLRPLQAEVGYAWVKYKLDKDFTSSKHAQETMDSTPVPVVFGPDNTWYLVDDHHTLCALDYADYPSTKLHVEVICDYRQRNSTEGFWTSLQQQNLVYLAAHSDDSLTSLPQLISHQNLPDKFSFTSSHKSLANDAFRSLAGYSRKVVKGIDSDVPTCEPSEEATCERCMYRGCYDGYGKTGPGVAYFEFRWAYFIQDASYTHSDAGYWSDRDDLVRFQDLFQPLYQTVDIDKVDTAKWLEAASAVVPLCRSSTQQVAAYSLPNSLFPLIGNNHNTSANTLPGYTAGYAALADDPTCDSPRCFM